MGDRSFDPEPDGRVAADHHLNAHLSCLGRLHDQVEAGRFKGDHANQVDVDNRREINSMAAILQTAHINDEMQVIRTQLFPGAGRAAQDHRPLQGCIADDHIARLNVRELDVHRSGELLRDKRILLVDRRTPDEE